MSAFKNLAGQEINGFLVINREPNNKNGKVMWKVRCLEEGHESIKTTLNVKRYRCYYCSHRVFKNIFLQQFNFLLVLSYDEKTSKEKKQSYWFCYCTYCNDKYNFRSIYAGYIISGTVTSCGCVSSESSAKKAKNKRKYIIGEIYNGFEIVKYSDRIYFDSNGYPNYSWLWVKCPFCQKSFEIFTSKVKTQISCGCQRSGGIGAGKKYKQTISEKKLFLELLS